VTFAGRAGGAIVVVGGGSWGTAFARLLQRRGLETILVVRDRGQAAAIDRDRANQRYLPGVDLDPALRIEGGDGGEAIAAASLVVLAVPSRAIAAAAAALAPHLQPGVPILSLAKGLDPGSGRRLSVVAAEAAGGAAVAVLSGPNHAEEIARGAPAATVVASADTALAIQLQDLLNGPDLRVYRNDDVVGVELCAAAKNVIALAAGIADGLGHGDNAKAALVTRGLAELGRLGAAFGADPRTFAGLAGLGDLVATCCSQHSRNRRAGELLARGVAAGDLEDVIGMVAEGVSTAPTLRRLARGSDLELPITERVCAVLEGESPAEAVALLMGRSPSAEY